MELSLKPVHRNSYPKRGLLIKGSNPTAWLAQMGHMGLSLQSVSVYPVAGDQANTVYGCVVLLNGGEQLQDIGSSNFLQLVNGKLFIPEHCDIHPMLADADWQKLFEDQYYFFDPQTGLHALPEAIDWAALISLPAQAECAITVPLKSVAIPRHITTFFIQADAEDLAANVEKPFDAADTEKLPFDMDKLLKGNQNEMDKFLKFLEKNPEQALKYAIPLDTLGATRGGGKAKFVFRKGFAARNPDLVQGLTVAVIAIVIIAVIVFIGQSVASGSSTFPLFVVIFIARLAYLLIKKAPELRKKSSSGGSALLDSGRFLTLQQKYENLAQQYIKQGDYKKAAHIYLKLLKNPVRAAAVLEQGKCYAEAAAIYINYCQDKQKAAECYEKAKIYNEAVHLYKELNMFEKTGDMYALLNRKDDADDYYNLVAENYKESSRFVMASLIYKDKIKQPSLASEILLEGWNTNKDAFNCLNNYFNNIADADMLQQSINTVYKGLEPGRQEAFLQVIKHEYTKHPDMSENLRNIAYEIIASKIVTDPGMASELIFFNKEDKGMVKDVMKYKAQVRTAARNAIT